MIVDSGVVIFRGAPFLKLGEDLWAPSREAAEPLLSNLNVCYRPWANDPSARMCRRGGTFPFFLERHCYECGDWVAGDAYNLDECRCNECVAELEDLWANAPWNKHTTLLYLRHVEEALLRQPLCERDLGDALYLLDGLRAQIVGAWALYPLDERKYSPAVIRFPRVGEREAVLA